MLMNDVQITESLWDEDGTLLVLASHGDKDAMLCLVKKYHGAIHGAAMTYATSYGYEDCFSAARLAFIERVYDGDPLNIKKFRTMLRQELADAVFKMLNPYGITRRGADKVGDGLFCEELHGGMVESTMPMKSDKPLSRQVEEVMNRVLDEEERSAIMSMLDHPHGTPEAWVAEDLGMARDTYRRRLASGFAKMRVALSGGNDE